MTTEETITDADGDGFTEDVDCNDADMQVSPEAMNFVMVPIITVMDIDEDVTNTFYGIQMVMVLATRN